MIRVSRRCSVVLVSLLAAAAVALSSVAAVANKRPRIAFTSRSGAQTPSARQRRTRARYWFSRRGLAFGVPAHAYRRAVAEMHRMTARQPPASTPAAATTDGFSWQFIGPEPISKELGNFFGVAPGQGDRFDATGRVTAVAADPATSGRILVGAANGGVWLSTTGGKTFVPIGDSLPTQAIGSIVLDPATSPPTVYVGTGEANNGIDSYYGQGIFKSTDLGGSWSELSAGTFDSVAIGKIALDTSTNPPAVFAAASAGLSGGRAGPRFSPSDPGKLGLWRSTDGGASWLHYGVDVHDPFGCSLAPGVFCPASDVAVDPSSPANVYAAIQGDGVFVSTDAGNSFEAACLSGDSPCSFPAGPGLMDRESLAVGPPAPGSPNACVGGTLPCGVVYAMVGSNDGATYAGIFSSTDGGSTWSEDTVPCDTFLQRTIDGTSDFFGSCGNASTLSQESSDQTMLVTPSDPNTLLFGGIGLYLSADGAFSWSFVPQSAPPLGIQPLPPMPPLPPAGNTHADQHALAIGPDGDTVYVGNDGGAYSFSLGEAEFGSPTFTSLNDTLPIAHIQTIAPHPTDNSRLLAGFQDNGTGLFTGGLAWNPVEVGDGGFVVFDRSKPHFAYHTFSVPSGAVVTGGVSGNAGLVWTHFVVDLTKRDKGFAFYPPIASDPSVARRVLLGGHFIWVLNFANGRVTRQSAQDLTGKCADGSCALQNIEFTSDRRRAWALSMSNAGGTPFKLFSTTQANRNAGARWADVTKNLGFDTSKTQATGISPDANNARDAYLSVSGFTASTGIGHIFRTTDFGATWIQADGAGGSSPLPDVPVLRVLVDRTDTSGKTIYAATDIGVFASTDGGATWSDFNLATIPAVPVFDIQQNTNGVIFISTHGRGAYELIRPGS
jgi:hypothetical protein